jgi:branched-chain amino acid transport system permease protein
MAEHPDPTPPAQPRIGVDEWVASHERRRDRGSGLAGSVRAAAAQVPRPAFFAAFVAAAALIPLLTSDGYLLRVGFDTLIYVLLALGLNTVVGEAGLLDLGYIAFFGFGAYLYAMFASDIFHQHWPTPAAVALAVVATVVLGLLVGLPARRLIGDYLAIVTLFFGQLFVTVVNNGNRISILGFTHGYNLTNGPNGITNIDSFHVFGHHLESLRSYFYVALLFFVAVLVTISLVSRSRTGRAWRSLREDALAAEMMGMPVNRLKLFAFAFGAGIAGLTGTLFASLQTGVYSSDFDTPLLITIYAMVILGGAGSLGGMVLGAIVVNVSLEVLRTPGHATWVFFVLILATLVAKLRPWRVLAAVIGGTAALGFAVYWIAVAIRPAADDGSGAVTGELGDALRHWVPIPADPKQAGNWAFIALVLLVLVLTVVRRLWRNVLLVPALYLAVYAWDARLAFEPSITRLIMIGVILIVLMNARPQGLLGTTRVEATA